MTRPLTLLVDYKGELYCAHKKSNVTTDLDRTEALFAAAGFAQEVRHFEDVDFRAQDFRGQWVLYQSSQDRDLLYKGFIEDVVLGLHLQGARLLPRFELLHAHHDKVFMEILRDLSPCGEVRSLWARRYGTFEQFAARVHDLPMPAVLKASAGDTGTAVRLVHTPEEALRWARELMYSPVRGDLWENLRRSALEGDFKRHSRHRAKLVAQEFVPGLAHDYKCLAFGDRLYLEVRGVRPGDFRASGSKVERVWPREVPEGLLDFISTLFRSFDTPFASIDIMHDGARFHLGEIQFLRFGTKPLVESPHHWHLQDDGWELVEGPAEWEAEIVRAVVEHIERKEAGSPPP